MFTYKISKPRRKRSKGAAIVEMVVTLPVFLTFLFYIIQYGYTLNAFVTLSNIARDTARYAAVHGTPDAACYAVKSYGEGTSAPANFGSSTGVTVTPMYESSTSPVVWTSLSGCTSTSTGTSSKWTAKTPCRIKVEYDFSRRNLHFPFVWLPNYLNSVQPAYATMYVEPQQ